MNTSFVLQNWANPILFGQLKNIFDFNGIEQRFVYPSNIVACSIKQDRISILRYIQRFEPHYSLHTDLSLILGRPKHFYLFSESDPQLILNTLIKLDPISAILDDLFGESSGEEPQSDCMEVDEVEAPQDNTHTGVVTFSIFAFAPPSTPPTQELGMEMDLDQSDQSDQSPRSLLKG